MRRISFFLTEPQFLDGTKTVTRRLGWKTLKAGDRLLAVNKCMGLKPGEKARILGEIEVVSARREPLHNIENADVAREGFGEWSRREFIEFFCASMKCHAEDLVTRIEFRKATPHTVEWYGVHRGTDGDMREVGWCFACGRQVYDGESEHHRKVTP